VNASQDAALAARFAVPAAAEPAKPAATGAATPAAPAPAATPAPAAAPPAANVERLSARAKGVEYEIPIYKYEAIFKPLEDLLEKKALPGQKTTPAKLPPKKKP
jgi:hypothetical protein